ncbi:hypothetical protein TMEN_5483 [Trichophyton mentagrophytes]|nr:hypothetical protein TMEN_5483 [Trichophyton mentagrophytes]
MITTIFDDIQIYPSESNFVWRLSPAFQPQFPSAQDISSDKPRDDTTEPDSTLPSSLPRISGVERPASDKTVDVEANTTAITSSASEPGDSLDLPIELADDDDCANEPEETCGYTNSESKRSPPPISVERDGKISLEWEDMENHSGKRSQQIQVVIPTKKARKWELEREEEAAFMRDQLKSGENVLLLQEVPKPKVSHCRAWNCMPERRTGKPTIRSYYRLALRAVSNSRSRSVEYYHITCVERFLPDLASLIKDGSLKMDGWISAPPESTVTIESSTEAIQDWFRYEGRTFDIGCYERFKKTHDKWESDWSLCCINHQLNHTESASSECYYCQGLPSPEEPRKADYFPKEPSAVLLSTLLASVSGGSHIDKWWCKKGV